MRDAASVAAASAWWRSRCWARLRFWCQRRPAPTSAASSATPSTTTSHGGRLAGRRGRSTASVEPAADESVWVTADTLVASQCRGRPLRTTLGDAERPDAVPVGLQGPVGGVARAALQHVVFAGLDRLEDHVQVATAAADGARERAEALGEAHEQLADVRVVRGEHVGERDRLVEELRHRL